jgi:hypothetical protein
MKVFNLVVPALLLPAQLAQRVAEAAALTQQSNFRWAGKPALAVIQQNQGADTTVASSQQFEAQEKTHERRSHTPYDTSHHLDTRGMTPWSYGTEMWPSWRDSDWVREPTEHGPNHEAKHDRSLGRSGPRAWPYMDEIISHFPDKTWVMLGFITGLLCCLPCICSGGVDDQQEGFNMGLVGLSISGLFVMFLILFAKLGYMEICWRIHILIWGYYWWVGLLLIPCTCLGVIGFFVFCVPTVCFKLYRVIFPPLSKDGGYGKEADEITHKALGHHTKHFEKRHPEASWKDLLPYGTEFLHHEPQPRTQHCRPEFQSSDVPYLPLLPREPGDWHQYATWNGSLSGT